MTVFNYMTIRGVPGTWQTTATGLLLLLAMLAGRLIQRGQPAAAAAAEAFRDEYAGMTWRGARLAKAAMALAALALAVVFAVINPRFATVANLVRLARTEHSAGDRRGRRDAWHHLAQCRHLAGLGDGARRGRGGPRRPGGRAVCRPRWWPASPPALAVYALNGVVVGGLGLDPLIVTLAAWIWARGLAVSLTGATTIAFQCRSCVHEHAARRPASRPASS